MTPALTLFLETFHIENPRDIKNYGPKETLPANGAKSSLTYYAQHFEHRIEIAKMLLEELEAADHRRRCPRDPNHRLEQNNENGAQPAGRVGPEVVYRCDTCEKDFNELEVKQAERKRAPG